MNNINLTPIIQAVIALMAALITYKLIPWIKARTTEAQQENLKTAVRILVFAAEELYGAGRGDEKLDYVVERLRAKGFDADVNVIKAEVYQAFHWTEDGKKEPDAAAAEEEEEDTG